MARGRKTHSAALLSTPQAKTGKNSHARPRHAGRHRRASAVVDGTCAGGWRRCPGKCLRSADGGAAEASPGGREDRWHERARHTFPYIKGQLRLRRPLARPRLQLRLHRAHHHRWHHGVRARLHDRPWQRDRGGRVQRPLPLYLQPHARGDYRQLSKRSGASSPTTTSSSGSGLKRAPSTRLLPEFSTHSGTSGGNTRASPSGRCDFTLTLMAFTL